ncbi:g5101 [Coccomyxa elongata]
MAAVDATTVASLTAPHLMYALIWFLPGLWKRVFSKPVKAFKVAATIGKALQFSAVVGWYVVKSREQGLKLDLLKVTWLQWGLFFGLVFLGQVLNIAVYQTLSTNGVYYGAKLGKKVAWKHGFPFNTVSHPQYLGAVLTIWGLTSLLWDVSPPGLTTLAAYWSLLYAITAFWEQFL